MYTHLNLKQRVCIAKLLRQNKSYRYIAKEVGCHVSTIQREYERNKDSDGIYRARHAHKKAKKRHQGKQDIHKKIENNNALYTYVTTALSHYWSAEQVSGFLKTRGDLPNVSHTTIYAFIERERPDLKKYKRHRKHRRKHKNLKAKYAKKRMIEERPQTVAQRVRIGDWEGDTIVGKERTKRILTLVDRKSGLLLAQCTEADSYSVWQGMKCLFAQVPAHTVTFDNGTEFSAFEKIEEDTGAKVYFAHPGKPQQRGCNENANGLLRQFFPKGSSFATISQRQLDEVVALINNRPRKRLGFRTPLEVFLEEMECCG
jgi:IS30 family transposase